MDTKKYAQGEHLTIDYVKSCAEGKNIGVIISDAEEERTNYGNRLLVKVNINGLIFKWTMNKTSVNNMQKVGSDSLTWLSKRVRFSVTVGKDNKEQLVGTPLLD